MDTIENNWEFYKNISSSLNTKLKFYDGASDAFVIHPLPSETHKNVSQLIIYILISNWSNATEPFIAT